MAKMQALFRTWDRRGINDGVDLFVGGLLRKDLVFNETFSFDLFQHWLIFKENLNNVE